MKERLAVVETKVNNIEKTVAAISVDVKTLLRNGATSKGKVSVWERLGYLIVAAVVGGICGKFWR